MIKGLEQLPHEEKLTNLQLFILKRRGMRRDIIKVYKIMHSVDKMEKLFSPSQNTRTRKMKLNPGRIWTDKIDCCCCCYFTQYVIRFWNSLLQDVMLAISFRKMLDQFMDVLDQWLLALMVV